MTTRTDLEFPSGSGSCTAWVYGPSEPDGASRRPCVVMANGFSLTRHDGLPAYAERLAAAGATVLLFDYRHLGDSPGQPRQRFRKAAQLEDWRSALAAARARPEVDGERIVLWGFSFGGAHAVETAAGALMKAPKVRCPLWVGLGDHDISVSGKAVARLAARAPRAELHRYPYSHFEPFMEQAPDKVAADQIDFLHRMGVL